MNRWLRTGVFTGALFCALVMTVVPVYAQGDNAGDAEAMELGVEYSGDTTDQTTWWSTDPCVPDRTPPEITLAGDNPQMIFNGANYVEEGFATVMDLCDGDMLALPAMPEYVTIEFYNSIEMLYTATVLYDDMVMEIEEIFNVLGDADRSADPVVPNPFNMIGGEYTISYLVADSAGNEALADRIVNVIDEPTILLLGEAAVTHECGTYFGDPGAEAYEADGTSLTVTDDSDTSFDEGVIGVYTITYTAQPAVGDPLVITRTVTVEDTAGPVIAIPGVELVVECGDPFTAPLPVAAVDICDSNVTKDDVEVDASGVDANLAGTYFIIYTVSDVNGNESMETRTVIVEDTVAPEMTLVGDETLTFDCDDLYVEEGVDNIFDTCGGALSNVMVSVYLYESLKTSEAIYDVEDWFNNNQAGNWGEYTFQYAVSDASGNEKIVERYLSIECGINLEVRVAQDMYDNFATDDTTKGDGNLDSSELDAIFARLTQADPVVFPNLARARFDMIVEEIRALDVDGNVTMQAISDYLDALVPELSMELIGANPMDVECKDTFVDPGAAVFWGDIQILTVYTADVVDNSSLGSTDVSYSYEGFGQPEITLQRTVNVVDTTGPVIGGVPMSREVECGSVFTAPAGAAIDVCEGPLVGAIVITGDDAVDTSVVGVEFEVLYNAEDSSGNAATQYSLAVIIVDTEAPVVTIDGATELTAPCGLELTLPTASATDGCDGALSAEATDLGGLDLLAPAVGVYTVTYSATDAEGNTGTATLTVTIEDTTAPVITIDGENPLAAECGIKISIPEATAADDCDGAVTVEITGLGGLNADDPEVGDYTVSYQATDAEGNIATADLTVNVSDTVAPVISIDGGDTLTAECSVLLVLPGATALDDCDGSVYVGSDEGTLDTVNPAVGVYEVIYEAQDAAANLANATLTVTVSDTTAPVVTIEGDDTLSAECGVEITLPDATAVDDCDGALTATVSDLAGLNLTSPAVGVYTVVYSAIDAALNEGTDSITVTVTDTAGPEITIDGGDTLTTECNVEFMLPDVTAFDACEGIAYDVTISDLDGLDTTNPVVGEYHVMYSTIQDGQGNAGAATLTVTVADTVAPVVTIDGPETIDATCGVEITLPDATAVDDCDGALTAAVSDLAGLNLTTPAVGVYTVVYSATDAALNEGTDSVTVTVTDTAAPVITLLGDASVTVECGDLYVDSGVTAADGCDGDLTASVVVVNNVNTSVVGTYYVTYNVSDAASNAAIEVVRQVDVVDTTDPTLIISGDLGLTIVDVLGNDVHQVPCNTVWDDLEGPQTTAADTCSSLGWLDVVVTAWPLDEVTFQVNGPAITDKSFTAIPGYYQLDYALADGALNTVVIEPGRYVVVDSQCIAVPDVYNLPEADAITAIQALGLVEDVQVAYTTEVIIGNVFEQDPAADTLVAPNSTVSITVARNVVPDLMGLTEAGAVAALEAVALQQNIAETIRTLDAVETGVYAQGTAAGTVVAPQTSIGFSVYVPYVVGLTETAAVAAIEAADYTAAITYQWSDTVAADIVVDQLTAGDGTSVPFNVSLGKRPSAIAMNPPGTMQVDCGGGQLWVDIDPLAQVQAGDGTVLVPDLTATTLELDDGMGGWTSVDPATDPLVVGQYQATYTYYHEYPGGIIIDLPEVGSVVRTINVVADTTAPVVTVYNDNPANAQTVPNPAPPPPTLDTFVYPVAAGTYTTWAAIAAVVGSPSGIYAEAVDDCDGTLNSLTNPASFMINVQYTDGVSAPVPVDTYGLSDTLPWLAVADPGYYLIIYIAMDGEGNMANESGFRLVQVQ